MKLGVNFITFFSTSWNYMAVKSLFTSQMQTELNIITLKQFTFLINMYLNPDFYSFSGSWFLVVKWWTTNSGNIEFFSYVSRTWYMPDILDPWLKTFQWLLGQLKPFKSLYPLYQKIDVTGIHGWMSVVGLDYTKRSFASRAVVFGTVRFIRKDSYLAHL